MNELQKQLLLELYTNNSIEEIDNNHGPRIVEIMGAANYSALKTDIEFNKYSHLLKKCRSEVELTKASNNSVQQVCAALDTLYKKRNKASEEEYSVYHTFYKLVLYGNWEKQLQDHFNYAVKNIVQKMQVFISYTTRNAQMNNAIYSTLIDPVVPEKIRKNQEGSRNLIVWAIKLHLIDNNQLTGYFDENKGVYEMGRNLPNMLEDYCQSCLIFLQILEKKTFDRDKEDLPNYCYKEFGYFYNNHVDPEIETVFIVRNPSIPDQPDTVYPTNFPEDFLPWRNVVHPITYLRLYPGKPLSEFLTELENTSNGIRDRSEMFLLNYKQKIMAEAAGN
jgi:hypothetical protein